MVAIFIIVGKRSNHCLYQIFEIIEILFINNDDLQCGSCIFIFNAINFISGDIEDFFEKLHCSYWNLNREFRILESFVGYSLMYFLKWFGSLIVVNRYLGCLYVCHSGYLLHKSFYISGSIPRLREVLIFIIIIYILSIYIQRYGVLGFSIFQKIKSLKLWSRMISSYSVKVYLSVILMFLKHNVITKFISCMSSLVYGKNTLHSGVLKFYLMNNLMIRIKCLLFILC